MYISGKNISKFVGNTFANFAGGKKTTTWVGTPANTTNKKKKKKKAQTE